MFGRAAVSKGRFMQRLLEEIDFRDRTRACANLAEVSESLPAEAGNRLQFLLAWSADPDSAVHYLLSLKQRQPDAFYRLALSPAGLQYLITVFSYSRFLSDEIQQSPEWIDQLVVSRNMHRVLSEDEFVQLLEEAVGNEGVPAPLTLALFRRQQILRILLRDLLGLGTLAEATEELSNLADALLEVTYRRIRADLEQKYGVPMFEGKPCGFSVLALGKLGGRELNYSSDIDLMFVYSGNGETNGTEPISNKEFFKKVANQYTSLLSTYTQEGLCYRVDLRLRPDGTLGEVSISFEGAKTYYQNRARDWELQMLIKARVAAGERNPGRDLLEAARPLIYSTTLDFGAVEQMSATRERLNEKLAAKRNDGLDVKLARGGIRDIEFMVQCLQRLHGGREQWIRQSGTLQALLRLRDKDIFSGPEYSRLASAYQFLRHLEHRLQFADDQQTHTLPTNREELTLLARKMPTAQVGGSPSADKLLQQVNAHLESVQEMYERVIHTQKPMYYTLASPQSGDSYPADLPSLTRTYSEPIESNLVRFLDAKAPGLRQMVSRGDLKRGHVPFEHFLERILPNAEWLNWLDSDPVFSGYLIDIFAHSPYFADVLVRWPELLAELHNMRVRPGRQTPYAQTADVLVDATDLRRYFRRKMLRIQAESICLHIPIFTTLEHTSNLADAAISAAYRLAIAQVREGVSTIPFEYEPVDQMMVIALGRLGMREFDLASDADLIFVIPEGDRAGKLFWTKVAERMIDIITAYTGDGVMFTVDTRLRPNGREGALVQSDGAYKDYFAHKAEAWESITYMKARGLAGNTEKTDAFLGELQDIDWRRYGQSGRSRKQLAQMRMRLEKEQGASNPLKAGRGGFYDIDFALLYLRLKSAGIFFKVLNTPERIDVIEKMGHLERADALFLRDAATFYRALDHGIRLSSGQAEGTLPQATAQLEMLTELMTRWTPEHLHDQPVPEEMAQIQTRTREFFDRLFGV
jgi:glutamate-ammonia-ligase adenylyltransferase